MHFGDELAHNPTMLSLEAQVGIDNYRISHAILVYCVVRQHASCPKITASMLSIEKNVNTT